MNHFYGTLVKLHQSDDKAADVSAYSCTIEFITKEEPEVKLVVVIIKKVFVRQDGPV